MAPGATWKEHRPFANATVCVTVSSFLQTGYMPAGISTAARLGPLGVSVTKTALRAEPLAGKARMASPAMRTTCAISRQCRIMTLDRSADRLRRP
jgi:hypothetical protein